MNPIDAKHRRRLAEDEERKYKAECEDLQRKIDLYREPTAAAWEIAEVKAAEQRAATSAQRAMALRTRLDKARNVVLPVNPIKCGYCEAANHGLCAKRLGFDCSCTKCRTKVVALR